MNPQFWLPLVCAVALLLGALASGRLSVTDDFFLVFIYSQSLIYIDVAPTLAASNLSYATGERYATLQWTVLLLFQIPLVLVYLWRRGRHTDATATPMPVDVPRAALLFGGSLALALVYFAIGLRHDLLFRRAGNVTTGQLELSFIEFALFRSFTEVGTFLIAVQLFVIRRCDPSERPRWMTASFALSALAFLVYALINSRMMSVLFLATLYGMYIMTARERVRMRLSVVLAGALAVIAGLYSLRVANNVRQAYGAGDSVFAAANFSPVVVDRGTQSDPWTSRLNGLDLIVLISDNVERTGPAWGRAWAIPFVISLDPIVRTEFTVQAKRVELTTAKSFLLLMYAGIAVPDYYSCMLSDAYGNLGALGFLAAALVLAVVLAWALPRIGGAGTPLSIALALFALTRVLAFEQEFGAVLYGWIKMVPFVLAVMLVFPLRTRLPVSPDAAAP